MAEEPILLSDDPAPHVRRLTLNRPNKRNALSNALRGELFDALEAADRDPEVRVIILRGAGKWLTLWQAILAVDPTFPNTGKVTDQAGRVVEDWRRFPDSVLIARAIRHAAGRQS